MGCQAVKCQAEWALMNYLQVNGEQKRKFGKCGDLMKHERWAWNGLKYIKRLTDKNEQTITIGKICIMTV